MKLLCIFKSRIKYKIMSRSHFKWHTKKKYCENRLICILSLNKYYVKFEHRVINTLIYIDICIRK